MFGITIPVAVDLSIPAGALLQNVKQRLSLPSSFDYQNQIGVRFEYALLNGNAQLPPERPLLEQGIRDRSLLWLQCTMHPFAAQSPQSGRLESVSFRGESPEAAALAFAQRRLTSVLEKAAVGKRRISRQS